MAVTAGNKVTAGDLSALATAINAEFAKRKTTVASGESLATYAANLLSTFNSSYKDTQGTTTTAAQMNYLLKAVYKIT